MVHLKKILRAEELPRLRNNLIKTFRRKTMYFGEELNYMAQVFKTGRNVIFSATVKTEGTLCLVSTYFLRLVIINAIE